MITNGASTIRSINYLDDLEKNCVHGASSRRQRCKRVRCRRQCRTPYLTTPPHLRPLDSAAQQPLRPLDGPPQLRPLDGAQQIRQMDQNAAAAAAYNNAAAAAQQYRAHDQAMAQQLQRQLPPQMLQNQALQMRNQQMTVQEYHNLLRLAQPTGLPQRRQTISGTSMSPQMSSNVPRLQRTATTIAPPFSSSLQFPHQMNASLGAPATSLPMPIPLQQQSLFAQQLMSNAMRANSSMAPHPVPMVPISQPQAAPSSSALSTPPTSTSNGGGAHLTRTLAESIQRSTTAQQQNQ
ncbi:hypothetical protein OSTOST_20161 [Ostertagia ostertagi]